MSTQATLFEIPHICDSICSYLDKKDIARCQLVCQNWLQGFTRNSWASCSLLNLPTFSRPQKQMILEHIHLIQSLTVPLFEGAILFHADPSHWHLQRLHFEPTSHSIDSALKTYRTVELILSNPNLKELSFHGPSSFWDSLATRPQVLEAITSLSSLKTLSVYGASVPFAAVLNVLWSAPPQLRKLDLTLTETQRWQVDPLLSVWGSTASFLDLESLSLSFYSGDSPSCYFVQEWPIISQLCPKLVKLALSGIVTRNSEEVVDILARNCPELKSLSLRLYLISGCLVERLARLWNGMKEFEVEIMSSGQDHYPFELVPSLMAQSGSTLENLSLLGLIRPCYEEVLQILQSCPRLKKLCLRPIKPSGTATETEDMQALVDCHWACKDLEILELDLSGLVPTPSTHLHEEGLTGDDDTGQAGTRSFTAAFIQFCRKLCTLPRLTDSSLYCGPEYLALVFDNGHIIRVSRSQRSTFPLHLLQYCPFLLQSCPQLKEMDLSKLLVDQDGGCSVDDLLSMTWVCKDLERLVISVRDDLGAGGTLPRFLDRLITLGDLREVQLQWIVRDTTLGIAMTMDRGSIKTFLTTGDAPGAVLTQAVCHLFSKCPELEHLSVNDPKAIHGVGLQEILSVEWVCQTIKHLDLAISYSIHVLSTTDPDLFQHHQEQAARMVSFFAPRIIKELPDLEKSDLTVGYQGLSRMRWVSPVFEMPWETALGYMDEDKKMSLRMARALGLLWKTLERIGKEALRKERVERQKMRMSLASSV